MDVEALAAALVDGSYVDFLADALTRRREIEETAALVAEVPAAVTAQNGAD